MSNMSIENQSAVPTSYHQVDAQAENKSKSAELLKAEKKVTGFTRFIFQNQISELERRINDVSSSKSEKEISEHKLIDLYEYASKLSHTSKLGALAGSLREYILSGKLGALRKKALEIIHPSTQNFKLSQLKEAVKDKKIMDENQNNIQKLRQQQSNISTKLTSAKQRKTQLQESQKSIKQSGELHKNLDQFLKEFKLNLGHLKEQKLNVALNDQNTEMDQNIGNLEKVIQNLDKQWPDFQENLKGLNKKQEDIPKALEQVDKEISELETQLKQVEDQLEEAHAKTPDNETQELVIYRARTHKVIQHVNQQIELGEAKRINLYTEDHRQIDGYVVYADKGKTDLKDKPILVMAQGNFMTAELAYDHAKALAKELNVNVVLYNPLGVGHSLGEQVSTGDSVSACEAAIKYALKEACTSDSGKVNTSKCAVYGHSLGGGISATAVDNLIHKGMKPLGLYVNHHSFTSLSGFVQGQVEAKTKSDFVAGLVEFLARMGLALIGFNNLNAKKALTNTKIANQVVVMTAGQDSLMKESGRLGNALASSKTVNDIMRKEVSTLGHNDEQTHLLISKHMDRYASHSEKELLKTKQEQEKSKLIENKKQDKARAAWVEKNKRPPTPKELKQIGKEAAIIQLTREERDEIEQKVSKIRLTDQEHYTSVVKDLQENEAYLDAFRDWAKNNSLQNS